MHEPKRLMAQAVVAIECHCPLGGSQCRTKLRHRRVIHSINLEPEELDENSCKQRMGLREVRIDRNRLLEHEPRRSSITAAELVLEVYAAQQIIICQQFVSSLTPCLIDPSSLDLDGHCGKDRQSVV